MNVIKMKKKTLYVYFYAIDASQKCSYFEEVEKTITSLSNKLPFKVYCRTITSLAELSFAKKEGILITNELSATTKKLGKLLIIACHNSFYSSSEYPELSSWPYWFDPNTRTLNIRKSNIENPRFLYEILSTYGCPPTVVVGDIGMKASQSIDLIKSLFPLLNYCQSEMLTKSKIDSGKKNLYSININEISGGLFGLSSDTDESFISVTELSNQNSTSNVPKIFFADVLKDRMRLVWHMNTLLSDIGLFKLYSTEQIMVHAMHGENEVRVAN